MEQKGLPEMSSRFSQHPAEIQDTNKEQLRERAKEFIKSEFEGFGPNKLATLLYGIIV